MVAATAAGLNAGVFVATVLTHSHIARAPTVEGRIGALAEHGTINPGSLRARMPSMAGFAMRARDLIAAKADAAVASNALAKAEADLAFLTKVDVVAARRAT